RSGPPVLQLSAKTDRKGMAVFENLGSNRYTIRAQRDGYVPLAASASVQISPPQSIQEISLSLSLGATISGRVRSSVGATVPNARVATVVLGYTNGRRTLQQGPSTQTDAQGEYRLSGLGPGDYYIRMEQTFPRIGAYYPSVTDLEKATPISIRG